MKTKIKPIKAWAVCNIDIDLTEIPHDIYFATVYFSERRAKLDLKETNTDNKIVRVHIIPVLITPIKPIKK